MNKPFFYLSYTEDERKVFSFSKESIDKKCRKLTYTPESVPKLRNYKNFYSI